MHWSRRWDFWTLNLNCCNLLRSFYITNKCNQYVICFSFIHFVRFFLCVTFKQLYLHTHWKLNTLYMKLFTRNSPHYHLYSSWNTLYMANTNWDIRNVRINPWINKRTDITLWLAQIRQSKLSDMKQYCAKFRTSKTLNEYDKWSLLKCIYMNKFETLRNNIN